MRSGDTTYAQYFSCWVFFLFLFFLDANCLSSPSPDGFEPNSSIRSAANVCSLWSILVLATGRTNSSHMSISWLYQYKGFFFHWEIKGGGGVLFGLQSVHAMRWSKSLVDAI